MDHLLKEDTTSNQVGLPSNEERRINPKSGFDETNEIGNEDDIDEHANRDEEEEGK
jgi:hypothetical protein